MQHGLASLIVSPAGMADIDRAAALSGIDSFRLMRSAGHAVAACALSRYPAAARFAILCGPGNNGGDALIAAAVLADAGASIRVFMLTDPSAMRGDAARALLACPVASAPLSDYRPEQGDVIIDGLFGAGLTRAVPPDVAALMRIVTGAGIPLIAIDLPSGIDGRTGVPLGGSFAASHTVTFVTRKPGHLLLPGRMLCGQLHVTDIGIPARIVRSHCGPIHENTPSLWREAVRTLDPSAHKYRRGHLVVFSGGATTNGAARMAATAGLGAGAGLVTMAAPADALPALSAHLTAVMMKIIDDRTALEALLQDARLTTFVLGPGFGDLDKARSFVAAVSRRYVVLDADGITAFKDEPEQLFDAFAGRVRLVLTPHDGEFARLFPDLGPDAMPSKIDRAMAAARRSNAVIVLKGADTVIADPEGRVAINTNAPPWLATAGSGDVLAGMIGAHLAQGMQAFEAAASGVWRHGEAGMLAGEGLTAEDLLRAIRPLSMV